MRPWRKKVDRKKSISLPSGENHLKSHKIKHSPCHFPNSLLLVTNENNVLFTQLSPVRASHVKPPLFSLDRFTPWGKSRFSLLFPCESLGPHAAPGIEGKMPDQESRRKMLDQESRRFRAGRPGSRDLVLSPRVVGSRPSSRVCATGNRVASERAPRRN